MIESLLLKRIDFRPDRTYGALIGPDGPFIFTLELPWRENEPQVSCFPRGSWECTRVISPRWGETFDIAVPGRKLLRVHWGSTEDDTLGCLITATTFDPTKGINGAVDSRKAFNEFMRTMRGVDRFTLHVEHT